METTSTRSRLPIQSPPQHRSHPAAHSCPALPSPHRVQSTRRGSSFRTSPARRANAPRKTRQLLPPRHQLRLEEQQKCLTAKSLSALTRLAVQMVCRSRASISSFLFPVPPSRVSCPLSPISSAADQKTPCCPPRSAPSPRHPSRDPRPAK